MKDLKVIPLFLLLCVAIIASGVWVGTLPHGGAKINRFGDTLTGFGAKSATNSSIGLAAGTSTLISVSNSARSYLNVCNDNAATTNIVMYLGLAATVSTSTGIRLNPSSCYEIRDVNMYIGNISALNASTTAATATLVTIP